MNRAGEARENKIPLSSDISDTDRLLQEASSVILIAWEKDQEIANIKYINRHTSGGIGTITWCKKTARYEI
jgi:hypothetical protein